MLLLSQAAEVVQVPANDSWLTQPKATIIAALGVILAALITFWGQNKTRTDQETQHNALIAEARRDREAQQRHNDAALAAQREEWHARLRHEGRRERASETQRQYAKVLGKMSDFDITSLLDDPVLPVEIDVDESDKEVLARFFGLFTVREVNGETLVQAWERTTLFADQEVVNAVNEWFSQGANGATWTALAAQREVIRLRMIAHLNDLQEGTGGGVLTPG